MTHMKDLIGSIFIWAVVKVFTLSALLCFISSQICSKNIDLLVRNYEQITSNRIAFSYKIESSLSSTRTILILLTDSS